MCGISGWISLQPVSADAFLRRHDRLHHRGPDDEGILVGQLTGHVQNTVQLCAHKHTVGSFLTGPRATEQPPAQVWMGHHRLSIVDLTEAGHQPISDASGTIWLVFNGEIYNYIELREELQGLGCVFQTQSDTEVVLQSWLTWGPECFRRFNGMWAIAVYDRQSGEVTLSRDRFGIKPLFVLSDTTRLMFASELQFFDPEDRGALHEETVASYVHDAVIDHNLHTFWTNISHFPPAHYATWKAGDTALQMHRYWSLPTPAERHGLPYSEAVDSIRSVFESAVALRLRSDVPVGSLLSGGLDSTAIVCSLAHNDMLPAQGFHSWSAVYGEEAFSEKKYIEDTVALVQGLQAHFVELTPAMVRERLPRMLQVQGSPVRSLAVLAQFSLYEAIKADGRLTVLLNGQGSDECFAGYSGMYISWLADALARGNIPEYLSRLKFVHGHRSMAPLSLVRQSAKEALLARRNQDYTQQLRNPWFTREFSREEPRLRDASPLEARLARNLQTATLPEYLRYEDRNSMAFSLESRLPFLDYRLVEAAYRLPTAYLIDSQSDKKVLRSAVKPYCTPSVLQRRDKMGFITPQAHWQHNALRDMVTEGLDCLDLDWLDKQAIQKDFNAYSNSDSAHYGPWWRLACMGYWQQL